MSSDLRARKYLIGSGSLLAWALAAWAEVAPDLQLHAIELGQDSDYQFDMKALDGIAPAEATAFVAWDSQFLNFRRMELMGELKARGFRLPPLVCRGAVVAADAVIGENCAIGAGAIVGAGCKIGFNSFVGAGCILGPQVQIGASAWIADGVQIGARSKVGANATVGSGVILASGAGVGKHAILDVPGRYTDTLADKTFLLTSFSRAVFIIDGG